MLKRTLGFVIVVDEIYGTIKVDHGKRLTNQVMQIMQIAVANVVQKNIHPYYFSLRNQ